MALGEQRLHLRTVANLLQEHFKRQDELLLKTLLECGGGGGASAACAPAGPFGGEPAASARPAGAGRFSSGEESDGEEADGGGFEGCKRGRTKASPGGARVADLVARYGGGRLRVAVAEDSGDAAAGGPSEVQGVEAGYGATTGAAVGGTHPDEENKQTADVTGVSGVSTGAAAASGEKRASSASAVNVYVQDCGGASAAAGEHYHGTDAYVQVATASGEACGGPIGGAQDDSVVLHAEAGNPTESEELQAATTAGGENSDVEEEHHEEADELRAAVTAGGSDAVPIEASEVLEEVRGPTLAEDERAAARRRRRRPREPLPQPPPSRSNQGRRAEEELEGLSEEWREVVALARRAGVQLVFGDEGDEI